MNTINNEIKIQKLNPLIPNTSPNRYRLDVNVQLNRQERFYELFRLLFYSVITFCTVACWKPARDLSTISFKRLVSNILNYHAIVDDTFCKTYKLISGKLIHRKEIANKLSKDCAYFSNKIVDKDSSKISEQTHSSLLELEKKSSPFNLPQDPFSVISKYLDTNARIAILKTCKKGKFVIENQTELDIKPLKFKLEKIQTALVDANLDKTFSGGICIISESNLFKCPGLSFQSRRDLFNLRISDLLSDHFKVNETLRKNKEIVKLMVSVNTDNFNDLHHYHNDEKMILAALKIRPLASNKGWLNPFTFASNDLLSNKKFLLKVFTINAAYLAFLPEELSENDKRELTLAALEEMNRNKKMGISIPDRRLGKYLPDCFKGDREIVLASVALDGSGYRLISEELKHDRDVIKTALFNEPSIFSELPSVFRDDEEIVLMALEQERVLKKIIDSERQFNYASIYLKNNKEFIKMSMERGLDVFAFRSEALTHDRDLVLLALNNKIEVRFDDSYGDLLKDKEIALLALKQDINFYAFISDSLKKDPEIAQIVFSKKGELLKVCKNLDLDKASVLTAVKNSEEALNYAEHFQDDEDVVLESIKYHPKSFSYASTRLKNNFNIVLAAVSKDGVALEHVSKELKNDPHIVMTATKNNGNALRFANKSFLEKREYVLEAVKTAGVPYIVISKFTHDKEIMFELVRRNGLRFENLSDEFQRDEKFILAALENNGLALKFVPNDIENYNKLALVAVKQNIFVLENVDCSKFLNDKEIMLMLLRRNGLNLKILSNELKRDEEIILAALENNGLALQYVPKDIENYNKLALVAVKQNIFVLENVDCSKFLNDKEIMLMLLRRNGLNLKILSNELKRDEEIILAALENNG
ncbi:MAG: DUF4116 domain-containing protein, partial [Parachlamydiaceae bacterium]|nr:DUF4116 domain-containing protein [Parachlamydiaceae bacterium]